MILCSEFYLFKILFSMFEIVIINHVYEMHDSEHVITFF